jgi:Ca2+-binding RTX toxin-like protein
MVVPVKIRFWAVRAMIHLRGGAGNDYIEGGAGEFDSLTYYGSAAGVNVDLALGKALNDGYGTVDTFFSIQSVQGSVFDDILLGSASDDTIVGEEGDDIIEGRGGNDILAGGAGDDTYVFSPGDGFDTIYDDEGVDTLVINGAVVPGNLVYTRVGNDLVIEIASGVTISGQFSGETSGVLEFASFAGGPVFEVPNPFMLSGLIALGEHYTINEETVLTGNVLANEIGTNVNSLTVIPGTIPTTGGGTVTLLANGDFSYMPALDFYGTDSFSYTVQGPGGVTSTTAAKIEVISTNDAPDAKDDSFIFKIGEPLTGNLLANDVDVDGDPLVAEETTITTALGASVYIGTDGNFIYSPPDGMLTGTDTFTYKILDSSGLSDTATVNLTIQLPNNAIKGTTRTDILIGTNANDVITGLKGDDILWGRNGNDLLSGDEGNDSAFGDDGDDVISGGIGNDNLLGNRGNDLLKGDEGNDILSGGEGNDTLLGGLGNDILEGGADQDIVDGGVGIDTLTYATALGAVTVDLAIVVEQNTRAAGLDTITGVENLVGSIFSDTLVGDANANKIEGWAGNDTIEGGFGNDTLYGDTGNDIVQGGAGNDVLNGGAGTDTVTYASATAAVTVNLATTTSQNTVGAGSDTITNFENLTGSGYNDTLTGNTGANRIDGGSGDDAIQGGTGNDTLIGGAGTDTVTYASATAAVTVNLATTAAQATGSAGSDTISGFENLTGSGYNDTLRGDTLANTVRGGNGNDKLYGNSGNDTLYGDAGTDTLYGDAGNDTLYGGASNDVLYGGANADIFKFASGGGIDTIKDFKTSELDKLDIKDLLSGYDPATKAITDFIQITTSGTSSIVKIDANGLTGGVAWTQIATLENITGLTDEAALKANGTIIA